MRNKHEPIEQMQIDPSNEFRLRYSYHLIGFLFAAIGTAFSGFSTENQIPCNYILRFKDVFA